MIIDATTQKPLVVSGADTPWPYIRLPLDQVPELRAILDRHGVRHTVRENSISFDGGRTWLSSNWLAGQTPPRFRTC